MTVIRQTLKSVEFRNLKRLKDVVINFEGHNVTGIFGPNGCGKSTVLHALACIYRPLDGVGEKNYFTRFFKGERNVTWRDSYLKAYFEVEGAPTDRVYKKGGDHWSPRLDKRLERVVRYLGLRSCVPDVENEPSSRTKCYLSPNSAPVGNLREILSAAGRCFGIEYGGYHWEDFASRKYQKVDVRDGLSYSSLAMGAGEQRLFTLLQELYSMPPYSLLLIDELDLTLHTSALQILVTIMNEVAESRHLQVVFTSHREELAYRTDINIRHIWYSNVEGCTKVLQKTTPECLQRLTGQMKKNFEVYVEDDLSESIAKQVLRANNMLKYTDVIRFGDASNAFLLAASDNIRSADRETAIFLLDGDVYRTEEERMKMMKKYWGGDEVDKVERRRKAISYIKQYTMPEGEHPEHYLWQQIKTTSSELGNLAKEIPEVHNDQHCYLYDMQNSSGENREVFLYKLIGELSAMEFWNNYVAELQAWVDERKAEV